MNRHQFLKAVPSGVAAAAMGQSGERDQVHVLPLKAFRPSVFVQFVDGLARDVFHCRYLSDRPPQFNLKRFRQHTDGWMQGRAFACGDVPKTPARKAFAHTVIVAPLVLPHGLEWAANLFDERTGAVMRALACYHIQTDRILLRYDVLCGVKE